MSAFATLKAAGRLREFEGGWRCECPACGGSLTFAALGNGSDPVASCERGCSVERIAAAAKPVPGRYQDRDLDLGLLMDEPDDPVPYVVRELAARQAVTVLAGSHGIGKSALAVTFASTAHMGGGAVAGIDVADARAVILDAEQGRRMIRRRAVALGLPRSLGYIDAGGLDVRRKDDQTFMVDGIRRRGAQLVIADSLRRLAPGVQENEDAMVAVLEGWAHVARKADAAVIVLAHRGKDTSKDYRGHSTIGDVADAVFVLERVAGDTDTTRRRLRQSKFRLDREPEDRWLRLTSAPFGIAAALPHDASPTRSSVADELLAVIAAKFPISQADALRAVGRKRDDKTGRAAIASMLESEPPQLVRDDAGLRPAPGVVVR